MEPRLLRDTRPASAWRTLNVKQVWKPSKSLSLFGVMAISKVPSQQRRERTFPWSGGKTPRIELYVILEITPPLFRVTQAHLFPPLSLQMYRSNMYAQTLENKASALDAGTSTDMILTVSG